MKLPEPTITAVMFVYNEEKHIKEMLTSIYEQTTPVTRVVIIDDYSTDNTLAVIQEFEEKHSNIEVYKSKQKGKVFAYVTGLEKVSTDFFFICAGDDYLLPDYVTHLLQETQEKNIDFIYARYYITDAELRNPVELKRKDIYSRSEIIRANRVSGYLFGKSAIINTILPLPTEVSFEDWITSLKLADKYSFVRLSSRPLFYYRKHASSTSETLKNIGMRKRDIQFITFLLGGLVVKLSEKDRHVLRIRLRYLQQLIGNYNFRDILQLLFSSELFAIDKIRLLMLLSPFIKDDNGAQRVLNRLAKFIP